MFQKRLTQLCSAACLFVLVSGCTYSAQTSSGADYMVRWAQDGDVAVTLDSFEEDVAAAASVEPLLRFPARIGLARLENGRLSPVPPEEADSWLALAADLEAAGIGEFVPVSPLIAAMVAPQRAQQQSHAYHDRPTLRETVHSIRLAGARQHLDSVLIYEVGSRSDRRKNALSVTDLTIIGAYLLPSRKVEVEGIAQAMLIDVRNGYPYGTAQATTDATKTVAAFRQRDAKTSLQAKVMAEATAALTKDVGQLFLTLAVTLPTQQVAQVAP